MGTLFIVSTPIGNLNDITLRALKILREVDLIACEDTRKTGQLLDHFNIDPRPELTSYFEENEEMRIPQLLTQLIQGKNIALVSNAGTPTISDPGFKLVREAISQGIKVEAIPGASAILSALVSSGLPTDKFLFLGFLPQKDSKRANIWEIVKRNEGITIIIYESPYKVQKTLEEMKEVLGDIEIVATRELTKIFEEIKKGKISEIVEELKKKAPKGEFTLLFNLKSE